MGKPFGDQTIRTASVSQKSIALSAVRINIDQKALENGILGHHNDSPKYRDLHNSTSTNKRSKVSCCEKSNSPSSAAVDDIDEGSESSDDLENEYDGIQNVETTGSDNVGDDDAVKTRMIH